jgi:hypothetical protein
MALAPGRRWLENRRCRGGRHQHGGRIDGLLEVLRKKAALADTHASTGTADTL